MTIVIDCFDIPVVVTNGDNAFPGSVCVASDYRDAETDIGQTKQAHITPVLTYIYIGVTCCL